jgi:hypothetical protein
MRLLIAIGYESHESSAAPFSVYVGRKHEEMVQAMEASRAVRFEIVKNPTVLRKRAAAKPSPKAVATEDEGLQWAASLEADPAAPVSPEAAALEADDEAAAAETVADPAPVSGKRKR